MIVFVIIKTKSINHVEKQIWNNITFVFFKATEPDIPKLISDPKQYCDWFLFINERAKINKNAFLISGLNNYEIVSFSFIKNGIYDKQKTSTIHFDPARGDNIPYIFSAKLIKELLIDKTRTIKPRFMSVNTILFEVAGLESSSLNFDYNEAEKLNRATSYLKMGSVAKINLIKMHIQAQNSFNYFENAAIDSIFNLYYITTFKDQIFKNLNAVDDEAYSNLLIAQKLLWRYIGDPKISYDGM